MISPCEPALAVPNVSSHRTQLATAEDMNVEVKNLLAGGAAGIDHRAEAGGGDTGFIGDRLDACCEFSPEITF